MSSLSGLPQLTIDPYLGLFPIAVATAAFYQLYRVDRVRWKIANPYHNFVITSSNIPIPDTCYLKVDLDNDHIPSASLENFTRFQKLSSGVLNREITGSFKPYMPTGD